MNAKRPRGRPRQYGRVTFTRLPAEVHARLKERATIERRTVSNLIAVLVEKGLGLQGTHGNAA